MVSTNSSSSFAGMRSSFQACVDTYLESKELSIFSQEFKDMKATDSEKKMALEQSIRDKYLVMWNANSSDVENFTKLISLCMSLVQFDLLSPMFSVTLLSDMFDSVTIGTAEKLFYFVQDSLQIWKSDVFFSPCRNFILRMCNDLLRRLPKSHNTKCSGQVLMFLAHYFPFSERSGLNIMSEFNVENVTKISENPNLNFEGDIINDIVPESLVSKVDNEFYTKFWTLQDFFRNPNYCYDEAKWKEFMESANTVLKIFSNCKAQSVTRKGKTVNIKNQSFSIKYLTGERLLVLQLNDNNFRRILLVQFLILFHYLKSYVKNRPDSYDLNAEQLEWLKSSSVIIAKLCKETTPEGFKFYQSVQSLLERESLWNKWKNDGCVPSKKKPTPPPREIKPERPDKKTVADIFEESKSTNKVVTTCMGKTKEWTVKSNYLPQCKKFTNLPSLKKRIEDIIQEADPSAMIEQRLKKVSDMKFIWQTLKLYHQKGPPRCFNSPGQAVPDKIPDYVEYLSKQISRDIAFKAIQARIKKNGELKARQAESQKRTKEDSDNKPERDVRLKTDERKKSTEEEMEVENDEDEVEVLEEEVEMVEEISSNGGSSSPESEDEDDEEEGGEEDQEKKESSQQNGESDLSNSKEKQVISKEGLELIAKEITSDWQKVAEKLGYKQDEIEYFSTQEDEEYERALYMLDVWFDNEEDASPDNLYDCLEALGMSDAAKLVLKYS